MNAAAGAPIMVVDDDPGTRLLVAGALQAKGYQITEVADGSEVESALARTGADLVLLDVVMPGRDGFSTCAGVRAEPATRDLPVVMMTSLDDLDAVTRAYDAGATDFVPKPLNLEIVCHRVRYILRSSATAAKLRASEARLATAQRIARLGHWQWDVRTDVVYWSASLREYFGLGEGSVSDAFHRFLARVHEDDRERVRAKFGVALKKRREFRLEHRMDGEPGSERVVRHECEVERDEQGAVLRLNGTVQDVTERHLAQRRIRELSNYDAGTGLPNRRLLGRMLEQALATAARVDSGVALLCVDIDEFNLVNHAHGTQAADAVLNEVADRLGGCLRDPIGADPAFPLPPGGYSGDAVARTGGDEFMVLLSPVARPDEAAAVAERICAAVGTPFSAGGHDIFLSVSIGILMAPQDGTDARTLLDNADALMHDAKISGRNNFRFFHPDVNARAARRLALLTRLRAAINAGGFEVHYQPKVALAGGGTVGCEALLRWNEAELGAVSPVEFIPIAEESGLVVPIGEWVLHAVCAQLDAWRAAGLPPVPVAINIAPEHFQDASLFARVAGNLAEFGLPPSLIELEITERALMERIDASRRVITALREFGVGVAVDDFGTGYSSLSHLKTFDLEVLKIDRCFVDGIDHDPRDAAIVGSVIELAHSLDLTVVAEGAERAAQIDALRAMGCDQVQGFFYSRPLAPDAFRDSLRGDSTSVPDRRRLRA